MEGREEIHRTARDYFEGLWRGGDPWDLDTSEFERAKYDRQFALIRGRRYAHALEIGCGSGCFTRRLVSVADRVVALDVAPSAVERARRAGAGPGAVEYRVSNIMEFDLRAEGPWDLVVLSETVYYLGWLYTFFDVGWLARELYETTRVGGHLLMANVYGIPTDHLTSPWLIRTYRDLFRNMGYRLVSEGTIGDSRPDVDVRSMICLFERLDTEGTCTP